MSYAYLSVVLFVFFFKQKTAYEMRISDWSSDVCSSDLAAAVAGIEGAAARLLLPARGRGARAAVRQAAARALLDGGLPGRDGTADHRRPGLVRGRTHLAVAGHRLRRDRGGDAAGRGALVLVDRRLPGRRAADLPGRGRDRRPELPLVLDPDRRTLRRHRDPHRLARAPRLPAPARRARPAQCHA